MLKLDMATAELAVIESRFKQLEKKVQTKILREIGKASMKIALPALKAEDVPEVSGLLRKSWGSKIRVYASAGRVWAVAGPKSKKAFHNQYEYYRKFIAKHGIVHEAKGERKQVQKPMNPAHYAHLAGPNRKGLAVARVRQRTKSQTVAAIDEVLRREVMRA